MNPNSKSCSTLRAYTYFLPWQLHGGRVGFVLHPLRIITSPNAMKLKVIPFITLDKGWEKYNHDIYHIIFIYSTDLNSNFN